MRDGWEEDEWSLDDDDGGDKINDGNDGLPTTDSPEAAFTPSFGQPEQQPSDDCGTITTTIRSTSTPEEVVLEKYVMRQLRSYAVEFTTNAAGLRDALNQTLHQKFHNNDTALRDLTAYYQSKPTLYEYTLQKELPRMKYRVVMRRSASEKSIVTLEDTEEIRNVFLSNRQKYQQQQPFVDLLWRAANQSLLADALSILTSPTGIVRPQYFATAVAHQVSFLVDLVQGFINCHATLNVSIPSGSATTTQAARVTIAEVRMNIIYAPAVQYQMHQHQPMLQCYITDVTAGSLLRNDPARFFLHLQGAAVTLARDWIELGYSEPGIENLIQELSCRQHVQRQPQLNPKLQVTRNNLFSTSAQALREALLHPDTQQAIYQASLMAKDAASKTNTGIASALKQLDSATGISTKVRLFGNIRLLPTAEDILEGEQHDRDVMNSECFSKPALIGGQQSPPTTPTHQPPACQKNASSNAPLFGGLLMSGLSRMAKSVSQPEDVRFPRPPTSNPKSESVQLNSSIPKRHQFNQTDISNLPSGRLFSDHGREGQQGPMGGTEKNVSDKDMGISRRKEEKEGWSDTEVDVDSDTDENNELDESCTDQLPDSNVPKRPMSEKYVASPLSQGIPITQPIPSIPASTARDAVVPPGTSMENSSMMSSSLYSSSSSSSEFLHVISATNSIWKSVEKDLTHSESDDDIGETRKRWVHPLALVPNGGARSWFVT